VAPTAGVTPTPLLPATYFFITLVKSLWRRLLFSFALGVMYTFQYLEITYNLPVKYIITSYADLPGIIKVVLVPICSCLVASLCAFGLARATHLSRLFSTYALVVRNRK
jgi:hypothetical protein